jgi:anti-sigma-K factor RskA
MNEQGTGSTPEGCGGNAAPYVLGALTEEEHVAFVAHLQSCAICRDEVSALEVVADALPAAAPQVLAPVELKDRVMATVRQEASLSAPAASLGRAPSRGGSFGWLQWRPALAGALVAGACALAAVLVSSSGGGAAHARVLDAQVLAPTGTATIHLSEGHAELDVADMPQTTPSRVYEVWLKRSGAPQPTDALFTVSSNGDATVGVPGSVNGVSEILVTSEPRGGSRVPTRSPVIVARLS